MARFPWQVYPGLPSPTPVVYVEIANASRRTVVTGLFDTGAVTSSLRKVEQARLGISDERCIPMAFNSASGVVAWQRFTVVSAWLDGHHFKLPTGLSADLPINLIGRVGLMDLWRITHDPATFTTDLAWTGPQAPSGSRPWAVAWENYWSDLLALGYDWPNWNANGRPRLSPQPRRPDPLPRLIR